MIAQNVKFFVASMSFFAVVATAHCTRSGLANPVHLVPTSPVYEKISKECDALKSSVDEHQKVRIEESNAPTLYRFINYVTKKLVAKTQLSMPEFYVYLGNDQESYNASMQKVTYTTTIITTSGSQRVTSELVSNQYRLTVGAEMVKLFTWSRADIPCFEAVLAHEIGHAAKDHTTQAVEHEYEADDFAISILDHPRNLEKGISMLTLSAHIYNNLDAIAGSETKEQVLYLARVLTSALIEEVPNLGTLGMSSSHSEFASSVHAALEPVLNPTATKGQAISAAQLVINAYGNLKKVCITPATKEFKQSNKQLDALTNKFFSPINHPAPKKRARRMRDRISQIEAGLVT